MKLIDLKTHLIDWDSVLPIETKGKTGVNTTHEYLSGSYRIRLSVYSANYESDHWCETGHIIHCIEGRLILRLKDGKEIPVTEGKSLLLGENDSHMAVTGNESAKIFIIDR